VRAGRPVDFSTARRLDVLVRPSGPVNSFATAEFLDTRGLVPGEPAEPLMTARIPFLVV